MPHRYSTNGDEVVIQVNCFTCKELHVFNVPKDGYEKWQNGLHIQDALATVSPDYREMLISGVCPNCWNKMFAGDENE